MSNRKILFTRTSTDFGNITAKLLAKNGLTVYAIMRDTNSKSKVQKGTLLDWVKSHQANLNINN
jgi:NADP-dependent 3-hydroxy acid dehydrogenase YdfG